MRPNIVDLARLDKDKLQQMSWIEGEQYIVECLRKEYNSLCSLSRKMSGEKVVYDKISEVEFKKKYILKAIRVREQDIDSVSKEEN